MSGSITICPVGPVDHAILERIAISIDSRCHVGCEIAPEIDIPEHAFDERRIQYNSKLILKDLILRCPKNTLKFMGVTAVDLFVPILKYVFGVAQMEGPCSVISIHRLRPEFYEQPPDPRLYLDRIKKTALHELGHSLGITHCRDRSCVMYSSYNIEDTDYKKALFCPTCYDLFKWYLQEL